VTGRRHETVAIEPHRIGGIEFEEARKQHGRDIGHAHRHARMPDFASSTASIAGKRIALAIPHAKHQRGRQCRTEQERSSRAPLAFHQLQDQQVRMSCIARSSFDPWITIELARDMKLFGIIDSEWKIDTAQFFNQITTIDSSGSDPPP
jgi:hypothetical protein